MAKVAQADGGAILIGRRIELALAAHVGRDEAISPGRPFIDDLHRCEKKWTDLLSGQRYPDARVKPALYTYEADGLAAPGL